MKVSLTACNDYTYSQVLESLRKNISLLGGIKKIIIPGQKVLIKPNMLAAASPEEAVCTHPTLVKSIIALVKEAGGIPYVGDSPAIGSAQKVAAKNGIGAVCSEMRVPLIEFNNPQEISFMKGHICKKFIVDKAVLDADIIINVPKLKTHGLTYFTGGVKNLYGCISGKQKVEFHLRMPSQKDFSKLLIDLYRLIKPKLTIMDGILGMEGNGPRNGKPKKIGVILSSISAVALDVVAASIINVDPLNIPTTKLALEQGVDIEDIKSIEIVGDSLEKFLVKDFAMSSAFSSITSLPRPIVGFLQNQLTAKPIISSKCIGCGICKDSCPPQTINIINSKAEISYENCIRCYCCQELCPHNAIELKKTTLGKILFRI